MSTRTSVRVGTLLDNAMRQKLPGYERVLEESTSQYLLFAYRRRVYGHYYATVFFQAAKTFGGVTCEVGVSRTEDIPYYRFYDRPRIGVSGFRARTEHVLKGLDARTTFFYNSPDTLMTCLMDLVLDALVAGNTLIEQAIPEIRAQYELWQPIYSDWLAAERNRDESNPARRYPDLVAEEVARKAIDLYLRTGRFDSFLGSKKFQYRQPELVDCHAYLLARALEFSEPPDQDELGELQIDPGQDPNKILFDPIASLTGRIEQPEAIQLSPGILARVPEWAFLQSFAALEAFYDKPYVALSEVPLGPAAEKAKPKEPVKIETPGLSLDELYGDLPATGTSNGSLVDISETRQRPTRPDPFQVFAAYLSEELGAPSEPVFDPFELLGDKLGIDG